MTTQHIPIKYSTNNIEFIRENTESDWNLLIGLIATE